MKLDQCSHLRINDGRCYNCGMTSEDILVESEIRIGVVGVTCPKCGASPGAFCFDPGKPRRSSHYERYVEHSR